MTGTPHITTVATTAMRIDETRHDLVEPAPLGMLPIARAATELGVSYSRAYGAMHGGRLGKHEQRAGHWFVSVSGVAEFRRLLEYETAARPALGYTSRTS